MVDKLVEEGEKKLIPFIRCFKFLSSFVCPHLMQLLLSKAKNILSTCKVKYLIFTEMTCKPTAS